MFMSILKIYASFAPNISTTFSCKLLVNQLYLFLQLHEIGSFFSVVLETLFYQVTNFFTDAVLHFQLSSAHNLSKIHCNPTVSYLDVWKISRDRVTIILT